jgi:hypothetical protein
MDRGSAVNGMKKQAVHWRRTMERWLRVEGSGYVLSVVGSVILLLLLRAAIFVASGW